MSPETVEPRGFPAQERSRQAYARILKAATGLLDRVGLEGFNTNALAAEAEVPVSTVYRYFPNKVAVLAAVAEASVAEWGTWFDALGELSDPAVPFASVWDRLLDAYYNGIRALPGGLALRRALRAVPELAAIDQRDNEVLAARVAEVFRTRWPGADPDALSVASLLLLETAVAGLDLALSGPPDRADLVVADLKALHTAYISSRFSFEGASHPR